MKRSQGAQAFQVWVKDLGGKTIALNEVQCEDSAARLIERIMAKLEMQGDADGFRLVCEGKQLDPDSPCGLAAGQTVHLLGNLRGGMRGGMPVGAGDVARVQQGKGIADLSRERFECTSSVGDGDHHESAQMLAAAGAGVIIDGGASQSTAAASNMTSDAAYDDAFACVGRPPFRAPASHPSHAAAENWTEKKGITREVEVRCLEESLPSFPSTL